MHSAPFSSCCASWVLRCFRTLCQASLATFFEIFPTAVHTKRVLSRQMCTHVLTVCVLFVDVRVLFGCCQAEKMAPKRSRPKWAWGSTSSARNFSRRADVRDPQDRRIALVSAIRFWLLLRSCTPFRASKICACQVLLTARGMAWHGRSLWRKRDWRAGVPTARAWPLACPQCLPGDIVPLSLSEAGPGRFGGQASVTDICHAMPCQASTLTQRAPNDNLRCACFFHSFARTPCHGRQNCTGTFH